MKSLIYSLTPYLDYFEEQTLFPKPLQHSTRTVITIIAVYDKFCEIIWVFVFFIMLPSYKMLLQTGADPEPPLPGGALVTNEAEGFTEARSAKRGRVGKGATPSRWWGSGGFPPGNLHQNGAFWAHLEVTYAPIYNWKYIWKMCLTINILFQNSSRI